METREVQLWHRRGSPFGGAEVTCCIRPPARESRSQQNDGVGRDWTVFGLGTRQIVNGDLIVGASLACLRDVHHDGGAEEPLERNLVDTLPALSEMHWCIQVRPAVLGGEETVRRVVEACRRHTVRVLSQPELFGRWPENALRVVCVRQIDELAGTERQW